MLETARKRLRDASSRTEADLRRATSDLYYALFHRVCEAVVEPLGVDPDNPAFLESYRILYRFPDHAYLEKRCKELSGMSFSDGINAFAERVIVLKNKRQQADYDPLSKSAISEVANDLAMVEAVLNAFNEADPQERTRFAYFVSIRNARVS